MIISKKFNAVCVGCKDVIVLHEYEGLEGGLYGSHHCPEISDMCCNGYDGDLFEKLEEVAFDRKERR